MRHWELGRLVRPKICLCGKNIDRTRLQGIVIFVVSVLDQQTTPNIGATGAVRGCVNHVVIRNWLCIILFAIHHKFSATEYSNVFVVFASAVT